MERVFASRRFFPQSLLRPLLAVLLALTVFSTPFSSVAQAGCSAGACVSAGPRLVSVDSTQGPLLNLLFRTLLPGSSINLSALDWNALAQTDIKLNALITQLGTNLNLSDTSQVLDANITLAQLQLAIVQVLQADGKTVAANIVQALPLSIGGLTGQIKLGDLLQIALPQGSLADINLDLLDLLTGGIQLYNFKNVVTTGTTPISVDTAALGLTGVASLSLSAQVVEPPVYVCGPTGTSFHSAAIRAKLNLELAQLDQAALNNITNALNALGLGLTNISLTAQVLKLQVYADIARAEGTIGTIDALNGTVNLNVRPGLAGLYIGTIPDAVFFNRSTVITDAIVQPITATNLGVHFNITLLGLGLAQVDIPLGVNLRAAATGAPSQQSLSFSAPFPKTQTTTAGLVSAGTLVTDLLNNLEVTIAPGTVVAKLVLGLIDVELPTSTLNAVVGAVQTAISPLISNVLTPVLNVVLGGVIDNLLSLLGIKIGNAVFTVEGMALSCATQLTLIKELQPSDATGLFNLLIADNGTTVASATNIGNGGATAAFVSTPGTEYQFSETAGTDTVLASYVSTWTCSDDQNNVISSGTGTSFSLTAPALSNAPTTITCKLINRTLQADLSITNTDGSSSYTPGGTGIYTITVSNAGPDAVTAATVDNPLPGGVTLSAPWTCTATSGSCASASGGSAGGQSVNLQLDLEVGGNATITVPVNYSSDPSAY